MLLRSLEIKNYRSLESVKLDNLTHFNVLIGRNNSGKSSIFGALALLNSSLRGQYGEWDTVLTGMEASRSLELTLVFSIRPQEREEFFKMVWPDQQEENLREQARNSPLFRQIEYLFRSPPGKPNLLHLRQTRVMAGTGQWVPIQFMHGDEQTSNPQSHLKRMAPGPLKESPLSAESLDVTNKNDVSASHMEAAWLNNNQYRNNAAIENDVMRWPFVQLDNYLGNSFFFTPFRHSLPRGRVELTEKLAQDGSNLAQVLHTINSNNRVLFSNIEKFLHDALPDIGMLQTPLLPNQDTEVAFRDRQRGYVVRLPNMGGGIQQLLMVATVLLTTGYKSSVFIEEPESHLHAGAQRYLIERLYQPDRQVFITTHSPTFVNLAHPSSMYQITYSSSRTTVTRLDNPNMLSEMLADIGSRNSDVLLSNAVLFVEGPGDRAAISIWSKTLGMTLEEHNVMLFSMGGGEHADRSAKVRSDVLTGISQKAPVPHLYVLDRDERKQSEVDRLQQVLGNRLFLLQSRELENYMLAPRALMAAIRKKCFDNVAVIQKLDETKPEEVKALIQATADNLYGLVMMKRIRAELGGLIGGLLPREIMTSLSSKAQEQGLEKIIQAEIEQRLDRHLKSLNISEVVRIQKEILDGEWANTERRLQIAPGEEIVAAVFKHFGTEYKKPEDTARIAKEMGADDIPGEIKELIQKAATLT